VPGASLVDGRDVSRRRSARDRADRVVAWPTSEAASGREGISVLDPWVEVRSTVTSIERREPQLLQPSDDSSHVPDCTRASPGRLATWRTRACTPSGGDADREAASESGN
jgi:hypothetical protein